MRHDLLDLWFLYMSSALYVFLQDTSACTLLAFRPCVYAFDTLDVPIPASIHLRHPLYHYIVIAPAGVPDHFQNVVLDDKRRNPWRRNLGLRNRASRDRSIARS
jgi:hypothetical protein